MPNSIAARKGAELDMKLDLQWYGVMDQNILSCPVLAERKRREVVKGDMSWIMAQSNVAESSWCMVSL